MRMIPRATCLALLAFALPLFAQAPAAPQPAPTSPPPTFQLADVHVSPHSNAPSIRGGQLHGDRYTTSQATMTNLIARSYNVESRFVYGGPSWLDLDRFDVVAQAPRTTSSDDIRLMLRSILVDRFKLVVHTDTKPLPAYVLTVAKGAPKLKPADTSGDSSAPAESGPTMNGCTY